MSKYFKNGKWRKKGSPAWLWKWTADGKRKGKERKLQRPQAAPEGGTDE